MGVQVAREVVKRAVVPESRASRFKARQVLDNLYILKSGSWGSSLLFLVFLLRKMK